MNGADRLDLVLLLLLRVGELQLDAGVLGRDLIDSVLAVRHSLSAPIWREAEHDLALREAAGIGRPAATMAATTVRRWMFMTVVSSSGGCVQAMLKRCTVVLWNVSPGRSTVDGNSGRFGRVGEVLRLEAHAVALPVGLAAAAAQPAVEEVAGVELDAGLGGLDLHHAARGRIGEARGVHEAAARRRGRARSSGRSRARAAAAASPLADARADRASARGSRTACRRPRRSRSGSASASTGRKRLAFSVSSWSSALPRAGEVVVAVVREVDDGRRGSSSRGSRCAIRSPASACSAPSRRGGPGSARRRRRSSA